MPGLSVFSCAAFSVFILHWQAVPALAPACTCRTAVIHDGSCCMGMSSNASLKPSVIYCSCIHSAFSPCMQHQHLLATHLKTFLSKTWVYPAYEYMLLPSCPTSTAQAWCICTPHIQSVYGQVLKDWYKRLPDELGALLADNKGADIKPPEERARLEMQSEEDFLKDEGWNEQQIRKLRSYCNNPVVEGANSKWSHMEVAR